MNKVVGILGGMGPRATADLFIKIIENTPAQMDQEHFRIIIDNNPQIPSRTEAIMAGGASPLPAMNRSIKFLEKAGVGLLAIPCHTAHYWLPELQKNTKVPICSLLEVTSQYLSKECNRIGRKILLLATESTIKVELYPKTLKNSNTNLLIPNPIEQKIVSAAIEGVKAGWGLTKNSLTQLNLLIEKYQSKGASAVLAGCTEISLLFPHLNIAVEKIDPTLLLAKKIVAYAK